MSSPGPSNISKWPLCKLKVFTARFYFVSYGNATITHRAAIRRSLENLEVYNYPHRQTENLHDMKTSREPETFPSLQSIVLNLRKCFKVVCNEGCKKTSGKYGENKTTNIAKEKKSPTPNIARLN